jgi:hypothetical protein
MIKPTLEPSEVPPLELGLINLKILGDRLGFSVALGDCEGELLIRQQSVGLGAIDRRVDLETNVKELASEEIGSRDS